MQHNEGCPFLCNYSFGALYGAGHGFVLNALPQRELDVVGDRLEGHGDLL